MFSACHEQRECVVLVADCAYTFLGNGDTQTSLNQDELFQCELLETFHSKLLSDIEGIENFSVYDEQNRCAY